MKTQAKFSAGFNARFKERKPLRALASAVAALVCAYFFPYLLAIPSPLALSNSVFSLAVFAAIWFLLYRAAAWESFAGFALAYPLGLLFSTFLVLGSRLTLSHAVPWRELSLYPAIVSFSFVFGLIILFLWRLPDRLRDRLPRAGRAEAFEASWAGTLLVKLRGYRFKWLIVWGIIFLAWVPLWIAVFPGFFCYDASAQLTMFQNGLGAPGGISAHHPLLHTVLLGGTVSLIRRISGSYNLGIAAYMLAQMLCMSGCFAFALYKLTQWGAARWLRVVAALYYMFFPVIALFTMASTKDGLFTAFAFLFVLLLLDLCRNPASFFRSPFQIFRVTAVAFLMLALRNNAVYAFALLALFLPLFLKRFRHNAFALFVPVLILHLLYIGTFSDALKVRKVGSREWLCVPMQQIAAAYTQNPGSFDDEEKETLFYTINKDGFASYDPRWADLIKNNFDSYYFDENPKQFLSLWLKKGIENPGIYVNAFLDNTLYAWYPDSIIDGYNRPGSELYPAGQTSYFEYAVEPPGTLRSGLPFLYDLYRNIAKETDVFKIPAVSMLFSVGAMFWALLFCLFYAWRRRASAVCAPLFFVLLLCGTVFLGPMVLVRYFLILFFLFPLFLCFYWNADRFQENPCAVAGSTRAPMLDKGGAAP
jgi:hypothetical protein